MRSLKVTSYILPGVRRIRDLQEGVEVRGRRAPGYRGHGDACVSGNFNDHSLEGAGCEQEEIARRDERAYEERGRLSIAGDELHRESACKFCKSKRPAPQLSEEGGRVFRAKVARYPRHCGGSPDRVHTQTVRRSSTTSRDHQWP